MLLELLELQEILEHRVRQVLQDLWVHLEALDLQEHLDLLEDQDR